MTAVWSDESKLEALAAIVASARVSNAKVMLCKTLTTVSDTDAYSTFASNEIGTTGYARQDADNWTSPALVGHRAVSYADMVTFTNSSGSPSDTITVWALVDNASSKIIQSGVFPAPFTIPAGDVTRFIPALTFRGETNSM